MKNEQMKPRRRRPGAGRKPIDPDGSVIAPIRFKRADWQRIQRLAKHHDWACSKEIRVAVGYWVRLLHKPEWRTAALLCLIAILIKRVEQRTGRKWIEDPLTGAAVRENVERLIFHFAPTPAEPVSVPPELASIAGELITIAENLYPRPGVPVIPAALLGDEWQTLALIVRDLGSGWQRNRKVWEMKS
jgi:hypothetical protein